MFLLFAYMYFCVPCACLMLTRPKYGVGSSGIGVMDGLDILCDAQN